MTTIHHFASEGSTQTRSTAVTTADRSPTVVFFFMSFL